MQIVKIGAAIACATLAGCSATIESQRVTPNDWSPKGNKLKGIVYYQPSLVKVTYEFTTLVDDKGKLLGTATEKTCGPVVQKEELQVWPDFADPVVLLNTPASLANSKFAATLNNGMLQSVNSETASTVGELLGAVAGVVGAVAPAGLVRAADNACNAGARISCMERVQPK